MKIGVLGSGPVAQTLAAGFLERGDAVMLGTRDTAKLAQWRGAAGVRASAGSFADAAAFGELIVLATHGEATVGVLESLAPAAFAGKTVIDTTNPLELRDGALRLTIGFSDSLGERIARAIPGAHVVKAFNTVGVELMLHPAFTDGPATMLIAGDDAAAKAEAAAIVRDFGWEPLDCGGIEMARLLEPMCELWIAIGKRSGRWNRAFTLVTAEPATTR